MIKCDVWWAFLSVLINCFNVALCRCILIGCCTVYIAWFCLLIFSIGCPDKYKV